MQVRSGRSDMKKFKQNKALLPSKPFYYATLITVILWLGWFIGTGKNSFILLAFTFTWGISLLASLLSDGFVVCCGDEALLCYWYSHLDRKVRYAEIKTIVITNYRENVGRFIVDHDERVKVGNKKIRQKISHVSLFRSDKVKSEICDTIDVSRLLSFEKGEGLIGSVCCIELLDELLRHVQKAPIYILQEVYERQKLEYNSLFFRIENPVYIVTERYKFTKYDCPWNGSALD